MYFEWKKRRRRRRAKSKQRAGRDPERMSRQMSRMTLNDAGEEIPVSDVSSPLILSTVFT